MAFDWRKTLQGHRGSGALTLVVLAVLFIGLIMLSNYGLRGLRADLTENRLYTLSPGTRHIIEGLQEPINLYFYFSREAAGERAADIKTYGDRVREVLEEMAARSRGKIRLETIDPEPFSEDEDRAAEFGLRAIPTGTAGESFYFGLAGTNSTDGRATIELFNPRQEEFLEYDIAKVIVELARPKKPVIGVLSTLPMGSDFNPMTGQASEPWAVTSQLEQLFTVRTLNADVASIDADVDVLLLVHPKALTPATLFAIDQFVLRGGRALIFVDPVAEILSAQAGPTDFGASPSSTLEPLLGAWGVTFSPTEVVADNRYALTVRGGFRPLRHIGLLGVEMDGLSQDDVVSSGLGTVNLGVAGHFTLAEGATAKLTPLITSSDEAAVLTSDRFQFLPDPGELLNGFAATGTKYVLAARLEGAIKSAFPDGPPAAPDRDAPIDAELGAQHIASADSANVVLVADVDMLSDRLWVQAQSFLGQRLYTAFANNGDFVINALDNLSGSADLIGLRSRATYTRPFTTVDELRRDADARFRETEQRLQAELADTERKLGELQSARNDTSSLLMSPEQQAEIQRFLDEQVRIRQELRTVRRELDRDIQQLGTTLKILNIIVVPVLFALVSLGVVFWRRSRKAAA
jgi:ABC-type uncharacterized transport system involved in gliding motility auxiliary subunit